MTLISLELARRRRAKDARKEGRIINKFYLSSGSDGETFPATDDVSLIWGSNYISYHLTFQVSSSRKYRDGRQIVKRPTSEQRPQKHHRLSMTMKTERQNNVQNRMDTLPMPINAINITLAPTVRLMVKRKLSIMHKISLQIKFPERLCKDGLVFNDYDINVEKCDLPYNIDCSKRPKLRELLYWIESESLIRSLYSEIETPIPSPNCPRQNGYHAAGDVKLCDKFFYCVDGMSNAITCPAGLVFNAKTGNYLPSGITPYLFANLMSIDNDLYLH